MIEKMNHVFYNMIAIIFLFEHTTRLVIQMTFSCIPHLFYLGDIEQNFLKEHEDYYE